MQNSLNLVAVDLGASSGRVMLLLCYFEFWMQQNRYQYFCYYGEK